MIFEQNSENLIKNRLKNKDVMTFWSFANLQETFSWPVDMDMQMSELIIIASQFSIHVVHRKDTNLIFQLWECWTCLNSYSSDFHLFFMQNNVDSNISWHTITSLGKILKFSKYYVQKIWQVVRLWHHQPTHLHIHSRCFQKYFVKICETA